jgi:hypothetical protein
MLHMPDILMFTLDSCLPFYFLWSIIASHFKRVHSSRDLNSQVYIQEG